ncbi:MAG: hypothetical protein ACD_39C00048G0001 [uncultured bacterium]|nr:MAG: hypothetical protein ACD_39C00048G0001 [uncultured bacterium]
MAGFADSSRQLVGFPELFDLHILQHDYLVANLQKLFNYLFARFQASFSAGFNSGRSGSQEKFVQFWRLNC